MIRKEVIDWLLSGDISIQYQAKRDLLNNERKDLRARKSREGWGNTFLSKRRPDGHWGRAFYQPKWTSTHYTLLDLRNLSIDPVHPLLQESVNIVATQERGADGGINPSGTISNSDVCINGMFLNYACYFKVDEAKILPVVDFILSQRLADGGFNCRYNRSGARHSSLHSTLSVLEGISEYELNDYKYRLDELKEAMKSAKEFILHHRLYLSDRTGDIIHKNFLRLSYPCRWKYDILRSLDYLQYSKAKWDERMQPAIDVLLQKMNKNARWNVQAKHPGQVHFEMEQPGKPSRWNTLRALRVLRWLPYDVYT